MELLMQCPKKNEDRIWYDVETEKMAIDALILTWKGQTREGLRYVVAAVENFAHRYSAKASIFNPSFSLMRLLSFFPSAGDYMIKDWLNSSKDLTDPIQIIRRFDLELWPRLVQGEATRVNMCGAVSDQVKLKITQMLKEAKCQNDFWEVRTLSETKEINAIATSNHRTENQDKPSFNVRNEMRIIRQLVNKLRNLAIANPNRCPNCFESHKLMECDQMNQDSMKNIAAYYLTDYEKQTNRSRERSQRAYNQWMDKGNNN
ncbi:hypothetical protein JCM33374_g5066 [Metschnikowia sp. JCM 33374]|nr:hypothetical protein JCM33374_g5066 [Metschnikowia sp. JCM 33374]